MRQRLVICREPSKAGIIAAILIIIFAGCNPPGKSDADPEKAVETGLPVRVQTVTTGSISHQLKSSGVMEAWDDITVAAEVGGKLENIFINEGQPVKKGELILTLEHDSLAHQLSSAEAGLKTAEETLKKIERGIRPEELAQIEAQLESSRIGLKNAEENFSRIQKLFEQGAVARVEVENAESQLAGAEAAFETALKSKELADLGAREEDREAARAAVQYARAQRDLLMTNYDKAFFKSPIDGTVAFIYIDPSEMVAPGTPLINVVSLDKLKLTIALSAEETMFFNAGTEVDVIVEAFQNKVFTGRITKIDVKADERSGTFGADIEILNNEGKLLPGMTASVILDYGWKDNVIVVPLDAIINRGQCKYVFVFENDKASMRQLFPGIITGNKAEIVSGLETGQKLIIEGHKNLKDGDLIEVMEEVQ